MNVRGSALAWAASGAFCGLAAGLMFGGLFHVHGPVLAVATAGAAIFLAWKFVQIRSDWMNR